MKKYLPLVLLFLGALIAAGAYIFVIRDRGEKDSKLQEETALLDVPLEMRPVASLTPTQDGHWLNLRIDKLVIDADSLDYELIYDVPGGVSQGVPGTVDLLDKDSFEVDLLLGSESSGKFRYDEGVEEGTLTLRFRDEKGRLLARFTTPFHLQTASRELTSLDGKFSYELDAASDEYFVIMQTFGVPSQLSGDVASGPYGIFSSADSKVRGEVEIDGVNVYYWGGESWLELKGPSSDIGIFVASK